MQSPDSASVAISLPLSECLSFSHFHLLIFILFPFIFLLLPFSFLISFPSPPSHFYFTPPLFSFTPLSLLLYPLLSYLLTLSLFFPFHLSLLHHHLFLSFHSPCLFSFTLFSLLLHSPISSPSHPFLFSLYGHKNWGKRKKSLSSLRGSWSQRSQKGARGIPFPGDSTMSLLTSRGLG